MKDITLEIRGRQFIGTSDEDNVELVTEGRVYRKRDAIYLAYKESEVSGYPGFMTTLRIKESNVRMNRIGSDGENTSTLDFVRGQRVESMYSTPAGNMRIEVLTRNIRNNLDEDGIGTIGIDYELSIQGITEARNNLEIISREN